MKKLAIILFFACTTFCVFAQVSQKMSYQAIVRNSKNELIISKPIGIKFSILQGSPSGFSVYTEIQNASSNANGLLTLKIGEGQSNIGTMSDIDWSNGPYFLKTETDPNGGNNYTITGVTEMMSVPYALYAERSGNSTDTYDWSKVGNGIYYNKGFVGVGNNSPKHDFDFTTTSTDAYRGAHFSQYSNNIASSAIFLKKYRGTRLSPQSARDGDYVGGVVFAAYNAAAPSVNYPIGTAIIGSHINGTVFEDYVPQDIYFATGASSTSTDPFQLGTVRMLISSQGNVGIGVNEPERPLHIKDVMRLEPRSSAPSNPSKGDMYFDNNTNKLRVFDGSVWQSCW